MKHAYLVVTHNNFYVLDKLLSLIDDERNDIYLHVDAKCDTFEFEKYKKIVNKSKIYFTNRHNVNWGNYSLIEAELSLFSYAQKNGLYSYYHLLSGTDLPIKNQEYIHNFFNMNSGKEFITCASKEYTNQCNIINRFNKFHHTKNKMYQILNKIGFNRYRNDFDVSFGSNWVSVTNDFVDYMLTCQKWIRKNFRYSHTCDEVYKQCIAINSRFRNNLYCDQHNRNTISFNMRLIDWSKGGAHPKTFTMEDVDLLVNSDCLFARKFDETIDKRIIDYIYEKVKN